ncbi:ribosome hibernation-promoting factor, HPF/YfiA family [Hypnocyclicus thermotrophus]|nr:ribosome-associated translation inhibitor RaiA [Hypnocyclicus thermotrophus]
MRIIISGKHLEITEAIRDYAEKKVGKLKKYFDNIIEVDITLSVENTKSEGEKHIADVLIFANGTKLKAEAADKNLYASIDEVIDILENQITKYKEKLRDNKHKHSEKFTLKKANRIFTEEEEKININGELKKIISTKVSTTKPMSVEEAILQMEALETSFYLFLNHETDELNIVYKRDDGDYGHVEPDWN